MLYKYLLFLIPLFLLVSVAQTLPNVYYTGYWTVDPGIRLYDICCAGSVQLPNNVIRLYTPGPTGMVSYISSGGLNFSMDSGIRIKGNATISPEDPTVILMQNGTYRIYYTIANTSNKNTTTQRIYTAASKDGFKFSNITPISDPNNLSFNNATGFASVPAARLFANGTIGLYYLYTSATQPISLCKSLYMFATSSDGTHFANRGCIGFSSGKSYNFIDPAWSILPNGSIMFISTTQSPLFNPEDLALGLYVSYSTDKTLLNFTTPRLIIAPPAANVINAVDLLQDPDLIYLVNGTYRIYYNVYTTTSGSNYAKPANPVYIDSASWIPTPNVFHNSTTTVTTASTFSTTIITTMLESTVPSTTISQQPQQNGVDFVLIIAAAITIIVLAVLFYFLSKMTG